MVITCVKEWNNELEQIIYSQKKIYIYGTGFCGKFCWDYIKNIGGDICAFVETYPKDISVYGKKVLSVDQLFKVVDGNTVCVVAVQKKHLDNIEQIIKGFDCQSYLTIDFEMLAEDALKQENDWFWEKNSVFSLMSDTESRITYKYGCVAKLSVKASYYLELHRKDLISIKAIDNKKYDYLGLDEWVKYGGYEKEDLIVFFPNKIWLDFCMPRLKEMGINVRALCSQIDIYWNKVVHGKYVLSIRDVKRLYPYKKILVACSLKWFSSFIKKYFEDNDISNENIILPCQLGHPFNMGRQYFDCDNFKFSYEEIFVDVGLYDGYTTIDFVNRVDAKYKYIYAFEPDIDNFNKCLATFRDYNINNISVINKGLWSKEDIISFENDGTACSKIANDGNLKIEVTTLDAIVPLGCTFIKMDIEGAEYDALLGARDVIKKYKPKLAISIYHKASDFIDIPLLIHDWVPEYKFDVRHYSLYKFETILYAYI